MVKTDTASEPELKSNIFHHSANRINLRSIKDKKFPNTHYNNFLTVCYLKLKNNASD